MSQFIYLFICVLLLPVFVDCILVGCQCLEGGGVGGRIILNWIFRKWDERAWTELI
jgi:hypothetical protein